MLSLLPTIIHLIPSPALINNASYIALSIVLAVAAMLRVLETCLEDEEVTDDLKSKFKKPLEVGNIIINILCSVGVGFMTIVVILNFIYQTQSEDLSYAVVLLILWFVFLWGVKKWNKERQSSKSETDKDENQTGGEK